MIKFINGMFFHAYKLLVFNHDIKSLPIEKGTLTLLFVIRLLLTMSYTALIGKFDISYLITVTIVQSLFYILMIHSLEYGRKFMGGMLILEILLTVIKLTCHMVGGLKMVVDFFDLAVLVAEFYLLIKILMTNKERV